MYPQFCPQKHQEAKEIWQNFIPHFKASMSKVSFDTWIIDTEPVSVDGQVFTIAIPKLKLSGFNLVAEKIEKIISDTMMADIELKIITKDELLLLQDGNSPKKDTNELNMKERYNFDNFVVGRSNREAHAYALGVATREDSCDDYNPLFIYGDSGLGKTHLLNAIYYYSQEHFPNKKVVYSSGEEWLNEFVTNLTENTPRKFDEKYKELDLLILDDVQFLAGKQGMQIQLFNTFNALNKMGKQIVFTSDKSPNELTELDKRLTSRFNSGVVIDVKSPDYETRLAIIQRKVKERGFDLPDAICELIAENITDNVRPIEGMIKRLIGFCDLTTTGKKGVPTEEDIMHLVKEILNSRDQIVPTEDVIIKAVCTYYDITEGEIRGSSRKKNIAQSRHIAIYLIRNMLNTSLVDIGQEFSQRDHSTVINSVNRIEQQLKEDSMLKAVIDDITNSIRYQYKL